MLNFRAFFNIFHYVLDKSQLFNLLCDKADDEYGGRLPVHVRCLLDKFANIMHIPRFEKLIATIRSREISASIILQSQSQLKAIFKDNALIQGVLQALVVALGAGLGVWGVINLMEGYGNDNPGAKSQIS